MNARRGFLKGFGLFGALAAGAASTKIVIEHAEKPVEDISHLAPPDNATSLRITGSYQEPKPSNDDMTFMTNGDERLRISNSGYYFMSSPVQTHGVDMTVGKDNRLWIKVNDQWKRVAIEA